MHVYTCIFIYNYISFAYSEEEDDGFERQESSDEEGDNDDDEDSDASGATDGVSARSLKNTEDVKRSYKAPPVPLGELEVPPEVTARMQRTLDTDDLSSDDEEADGNTIGRVPLHWYDAYDHIGYDTNEQKLIRSKFSLEFINI
jgi:ribosome biogenesis protein ERB1